MPFLFYVLLVTAFAGLTVRLSGAEESLSALKLDYEVSRERLGEPLAALRASYRKRLDILEKEVTAAGDLTAVLAVKEALLAIEGGVPGPVAEHAELKRLQEIYWTQARALDGDETAALIKTTEEYVARLALLEKALTKQSRIDEALAIRGERERRSKELVGWSEAQAVLSTPEEGPDKGKDDELSWKAMQGGKVSTVEDETYVITGPGAAQDRSVAAITLLDRALASSLRITGKCLITGEWGGFILGADKGLSDYIMLYSPPAGTSFNYELVVEGVRTGPWMGAAVTIQRDEWLDFSIERKGEVWKFEINGAEKEFSPVVGEKRDYFGMMVFRGSEMRIKNLRIRE